MVIKFYEAWTFFGLDFFRCRTDMTPTHIITLNYVIFSNY